MVSSFIQHTKYALRQLRRNPGFGAVAVLTLALGIGPNVAIFSVIWGTFLAPLPYPNGKQLVVVWTKIKGERSPTKFDDYLQYASQSKSFQRLDFGAWAEVHLTDPDPSAQPVSGGFSMPGFFTNTLGEGVAMGRDFLPEEGTPGNDHVVIINHRLWLERFHGDRNILGKQIPVEGQPYTVVGVRKPGPGDRANSQFDVPFVFTPGGRDSRVGNVFGRLKPGVSLAQAEAELRVTDSRLAAARGELPKDAWSIGVEPLKNDWLDKTLERNLWLLLAAVGFVLLIACANVANLLLARGTARQREIAVRAAIGASRWQVFAQLLTEGLLLAIFACTIGVGGGWALLKFVIVLLPDLVHQTSEAVIELNVPVLLFAIGVTLVAGILFGCAPAWRASKLTLTEVLNQGSQSVIGGRRGRVQGLLVIAEFALAITLLAGAGMAMHSFVNLSRVDLGFRTDHILLVGVRTHNTEHPGSEQIAASARQLLDKLRAIPGVQNASMSTGLPLDGAGSFPFKIAGQPVSADHQPVADFESVTPTYFDTFGVRLLRGRLLNDNDTASGNLVVVVSESFVRRYLPGMDPLTQRVLLERPIPNQKDGPTVEWQIVGVFGDVQNRERMTDKPQPEVFGSFWQIPWPNVGIAVRTAVDPNLVAKSVRFAVVMAEPTRLLSPIDTIERRVSDQLMGGRFAMVLFGGFAALALVLAALGIYGVMSFAVAQRHHEIGLRMALGAQREQVIKLILTDGLRLAFYGVGIGLLGVYGVGLLMRSTLYGVRTFDLRSFAAVVVVLVAAAVIASYVPARRSAKVDPMVALRYE